ncbi:MAG: hypothetical protein A2289_26610 [Deltaproteobacteria bacterium RIFOXYA12_FULL_58_15]|nr:MAG: hypothetical protein A2289_26610 [Deltaproteobacteria bacterium RIFOXYA12_FULL_58_15]OGR14089.1 MAG: hypothetical protein A2341_14620 [Deltaproteobacteria bacterium RIFOXYB12_FULL_58_9]
MGLLSKLTSDSTPTKKPGDDVLLLHGMMLMAGADGVIESKEISILEAFFNTLPEFKGKDFDELMSSAHRILTRYENIKESVKALADIADEAVRRKLFVLAADIAMSSGDVDEHEDELLEAMQQLLNVDDDTATKILEVLSMKYQI